MLCWSKGKKKDPRGSIVTIVQGLTTSNSLFCILIRFILCSDMRFIYIIIKAPYLVLGFQLSLRVSRLRLKSKIGEELGYKCHVPKMDVK